MKQVKQLPFLMESDAREISETKKCRNCGGKLKYSTPSYCNVTKGVEEWERQVTNFYCVDCDYILQYFRERKTGLAPWVSELKK